VGQRVSGCRVPTVVDFDATITNSSSTTIYLNDAGGTTTSSFLSVNDSPFFANATVSLAPGQTSGPFELYAVDLAKNTSLGSYVGNGFEIQGGPTEATSRHSATLQMRNSLCQ
jgi:hypothetical protein